MSTVDFRRPSNPFATRYVAPGASSYHWIDPIDGRLCCSERDSLDWLVDRLVASRRAAILGPHGSGKSSLLKALEPSVRQRFSGVHHLRIEPGRRVQQVWSIAAAAGGLRRGALWLIDGLERLGVAGVRLVDAAARWRGAYLLVTLHRDVPFLPVVWRTELDSDLAKRLTANRLCAYPEHHDALMTGWDRRWQRSAGNLRELWFELFDEFERLERAAQATRPPCPPEVSFTAQRVSHVGPTHGGDQSNAARIEPAANAGSGFDHRTHRPPWHRRQRDRFA